MKNFFSYTYRSEIDINAPKAKVWQVLTDIASYPKWNPFTIHIDSSWEMGSEVFITVRMNPAKNNTSIRTEYLMAYDPPERLVWGFNYGVILKAKRTQLLTFINENTTKYTNVDQITGLLSPIVQLFYGKWIQLGFNSLSQALKEFIEYDGPEK